jgi:ATP-dependent protease ClpP protease subunit
MKEIAIDGDIGYGWWSDSGVTAKGIEEQLKGIDTGEDIKITINSPGGSVYEGIVIFNLIRDYAKTHPVSVRINCIALSIASYIALAARTVDRNAKITASENSIVMIHNPWGVAWGDYRQFKKEADYFEKLAAVYGSVHTAVSGKSEKEIREAMDAETYYIGKEIEAAGFSNDWEEITDGRDNETNMSAAARDGMIINAKLAVGKTIEKAQAAKNKNDAAYNDSLKKAVALYYEISKPPAPESAGKEAEIKVIGGIMKPEELLAQHKECYDAVFALGEKAAVEKERRRVAAHIARGKKIGALDIALKHIQGGAEITDEAVNEEYFSAAVDAKRAAARNADDPPPLDTGGCGGDADDARLAAAFDKGYRAGKNGYEGGGI